MLFRDLEADRPPLLDLPTYPDWPPLERAPPIDLAPWHAERPHLVANALATVGQAAPHLAGLARLVIPRMARRILATSTLKTAGASSGLMLLDDAVQQEHIGIRTPTHAYAVAVDADHADWPELIEDLSGYGLPHPTWTCADPWSGRAHLVWWLRDAVVLTEAGRTAPIRLLSTVAALLTEAFRGDAGYTGTLTKNPFRVGRPLTRSGSPPVPAVWEAHRETTPNMRHSVIVRPELHDLTVLRRALLAWQADTGTPIPGRRRKVVTPEDVILPGTQLFHTLRYRVYAGWPMSAADVHGLAIEQAATLGSPIRDRQLLGMARRIHTWCSRHYTGKANRGRDRLDGCGLDMAERQRIAGLNTARDKRFARPVTLEQAASRVLASGRTLTKSTLAAEANVSPRTVQRWWGGGDKCCPSGKAVATAPSGPKAPPSKNQNPFPSSLAARSQADRQIKGVLAQLADLVAAAMCPGVVPPSIPEIPSEILGSPDVRKALAVARQAIRDAERRMDARAAKAAAADRLSEFRAAAAGVHPWTWWTNHRAALDAEFDAREQEPGLDRHALAGIRASREAVFAARWRLWRRVTGPQPIPLPLAETQAARMARIARETAEALADLDWDFGPDS